jgi:hypothetical protein
MSRRTLDRPRRTSLPERLPEMPPDRPPERPQGGEAEGQGKARAAGAGSLTALNEEDQRREPRRPANGLVVVRFGQPEREVRGRLVDISVSGFRIAHDCKTLETGQTVEFSHPEACGKARVVWNRIAVSGVETGLVLVGL